MALTQAQSVAQENTTIMIELGLLHLRLGEGGRAFELFGTALSYDPRDTKAILAAGSIIQDQDDYDVALVKYRVAAAQTPESAELWNNVGMCFFGNKKYIAAVACLKHAAYLAPFEWMVAFNLGLVHLTVGQLASAFHFFTSAVNLKSDFGPSFGLLAVTLHKLGDYINAIAAFEKSLQLAPEDPITLLNYIIMLLDAGEKDQTSELWNRFKRVAHQRQSFLNDNPGIKATAKRVSSLLKTTA